jgi:hypothetical protein
MRLDEAAGPTVADVTHSRLKALAWTVTVAEVRAWFAASASHHMALLADDGRFAGSLVPDDLPADADPERRRRLRPA